MNALGVSMYASSFPVVTFWIVHFHLFPSTQMKKLLRKQRKREQLIDSSEDDDGGDDGGVTLSSDDANAGGGNSDAVRLKVKLLTEHVSGDDRETDVVAEIVSENSYEDWQVDVETRLTCLPGGFIKTDKFE